MKIWLYMICCSFIIVGCSNDKLAHDKELSINRMKHSTKQQQEKAYITSTVEFVEVNNEKFVSVEKFTKALGYMFEYDEMNRTLRINNGQVDYSFIYRVPVFNKGVEAIPTSRTTFEIIENEPYIAADFLEADLKINIQPKQNMLVLKILKDQKDLPVTATPEAPKNMDEILSLMSILDIPIKGASVDTVSSHLPGAKRDYRHGTHEGMDFYEYSSNVTINRETPVYGMAEGKIVRADHDYSPYASEEERNQDLQLAATLPTTPEYMLDKLRGRQVWIAYPNGILARYAHLDSIPETIHVGDSVTKDTIVGYVGNSGTSGEVKGDDSELHLHLDILIHNELFWKDLATEEVKQVLKTVFEAK